MNMRITARRFAGLAVFAAVIGAAGLAQTGHANNASQVVPPVDPYLLTFEQYENSEVQDVFYVYDLAGVLRFNHQLGDGTLVNDRVANATEITAYTDHKNLLLKQAASAELVGDFEIGQNVHQWTDNRAAELAQCETDMLAGTATLFNNLGVNGQNLTIQRMQQCIATNARVNRITIVKLEQLLVDRGIIDPE